MLTLWGSSTGNGFCDGMGRRDFIRLGALGAGVSTLTLADLLRHKAHGASPKTAGKARAAIMIYLPGGP